MTNPAGQFDGSVTQPTSEWLGWAKVPTVRIPPTPPSPAGRWTYWDTSTVGRTQEWLSDGKTEYIPPDIPSTVHVPGRWVYWDVQRQTLPSLYDPPAANLGIFPPAVAATYKLLVDHYLASGYATAGTLITEGIDVPFGWVPSMAVDPIGAAAIQAFWNAGPRGVWDGERNRDLYPFTTFSAPVVYWQNVPGSLNLFQLTGAGASLGPKEGILPDLDQGGTPTQRVRVWMGPSLGWIEQQVRPQVNVVSGGTTTIQPGTSIVLVDVAALVTINLPDVAAWMREPAYNPMTAFERCIWIKDIGGNAAAFNITIHPFAGQAIDKLVQDFKIIQNRQLIRLYPRNDLTGWISG